MVSSWRRGTNLTCSLALLVLVLVLTVLYLVWQVSCAGCHMAARRHACAWSHIQLLVLLGLGVLLA